MSFPIRTSSESDRLPYTDDLDEIQYTQHTGVSNVRTLKPPPEIWELVHPATEQKFKPRKVLTARLATKNVLMVTVAILLASGIGAASWKLHIPQKLAAVFREPDVPAKKIVPATLGRAAVDASKSTPATVTSTGAADVTLPTELNSHTDVVQGNAIAAKRSVRTAPKPSDGPSSPPANTSSANAVVAPAISRPRAVATTKEQQRNLKQNSNADSGTSVSETSGTSKPNGVADNSSARPKETKSGGSSDTAAPKITSPKPKVIQWP